MVAALVAVFLFGRAVLPAGAIEVGRPTVYVDGWVGAFLGLPADLTVPEEPGMGAGTSVGAYFDLGRRVDGALRLTYWEAWDSETFSRRYTGVDALLGPRFGDLRLLAGLAVLDRRDFTGEQWGGWGWRVGVFGERVVGRFVLGGGLYAAPRLLLRRWLGSSEQTPTAGAALEEEFYLVVPLGGTWAVRGGYRGFQLGVDENAGRRWEDGEGLFLGATARF